MQNINNYQWFYNHQRKEKNMIDAETFYAALSQGKTEEVKKLTQGALDAGEKAESILKDGMLPAMEQIGLKFKNNEIYIPDNILKEWKIPTDYLKSNNIKKFKTHLLNEREYEFLSYCATDYEYKGIADRMDIEYATLNIYRASVCKKLNIHSRAGLAVYAKHYGLGFKQF